MLIASHVVHNPNTVSFKTRLAAVAGGLVGQAPNALLTEQIGWRAVEWCLFGLQVVILVTLVVLWIIECSHNNKRAHRRQHQKQNQPESGVATTEDGTPSHRAVAKAPSASVERGVATAYRRAGRSPPHLIWLSQACDETMPGHQDEKCFNILPLQHIIRQEVERPEFPWAVFFEAQHSHIPRPAGYSPPLHGSVGACGQFDHMIHFPGMVSDQKWRLMLNLLAHLTRHGNETSRR